MRRICTRQLVKDIVIASVAFTTGSLTSGLIYDRNRKSVSPGVVLERTHVVVNDTQDHLPPHSPSSKSVFSPNAPLPKPVAQVGLPTEDPMKVMPGFISLYDRRNRIPRWTLELLTKDRLNDAHDAVDRKQFAFIEDPGEPPEFRSTNSDYFRSGFDRGHMAAAGNNRLDAECMQKTFVLSNIAPQVGSGFNRGIWNDLEKYVRAIARRSAHVVVVTGPLFLPQSARSVRGHRQVMYEVIGENNVAVPTHFFKAVAVQERPNGSWKTYAWVMPNQALPEGTRVISFAVPLTDVERTAGFKIFPNLHKP